MPRREDHAFGICTIKLRDSLAGIFVSFVGHKGGAFRPPSAVIKELKFGDRTDTLKKLLKLLAGSPDAGNITQRTFKSSSPSS
jgi:hypothetical protein